MLDKLLLTSEIKERAKRAKKQEVKCKEELISVKEWVDEHKANLEDFKTERARQIKENKNADEFFKVEMDKLVKKMEI